MAHRRHRTFSRQDQSLIAVVGQRQDALTPCEQRIDDETDAKGTLRPPRARWRVRRHRHRLTPADRARRHLQARRIERLHAVRGHAGRHGPRVRLADAGAAPQGDGRGDAHPATVARNARGRRRGDRRDNVGPRRDRCTRLARTRRAEGGGSRHPIGARYHARHARAQRLCGTRRRSRIRPRRHHDRHAARAPTAATHPGAPGRDRDWGRVRRCHEAPRRVAGACRCGAC